MGFNAVRQGIVGFVTNSHCTATQGLTEGTVFYQPTSPTRVGAETADPPFFTGGVCPASYRCRYSETVFVGGDRPQDHDQGGVAKMSLRSLEWDGTRTYRVVSEGDPVVGRRVRKIGRTTGTTQGTVTRTCAAFNLSGTDIVFLCQGVAEIDSAPGDSGSAVFKPSGGSRISLPATLWGGGIQPGAGFISAFSTMSSIQLPDELGDLATCSSGYTC